MINSLYILGQGIRTISNEERIEFVRWSSDNPLLVGGVATAVGLYFVYWLYKREARGRVSRGLRWTLVATRMLVLLVLGLIGLEPVAVHYQQRREDASVLVLVDKSASMSLADYYRQRENAERIAKVRGEIPAEGAARADLVKQLLFGQGQVWKRLSKKTDIKAYLFSDGVQLASAQEKSGEEAGEDNSDSSTEASLQPFMLHADGAMTDLGTAVRSGLQAAGQPVSGIVLLSDGEFNHGESVGEIAQLLNQRGIPIYPVGIGDPQKPVNLRIAEIAAPRSIFKNDPFSVSVKLEVEDVQESTFNIELLERSGQGEMKVVDSKTVVRTKEGVFPKVVFDRKIAQAGSVNYRARIAPLPYETIVADNERELLPAVHVLDDKMRILLVAGSPSYDYRFLSRMLEREQTVELSTWLQSADINAVRDGTKVIKELPTAPENIFKYDVIVLMDVDPADLDPAWGSTLSVFVTDHAGGILLAAGNKYAGPFFRSPKTKSIVEILPVVPDPDAEILLNELGHYQTRAWPVSVPDEAGDDSLVRLASTAQASSDIWQSLGGVYWHYPVRREKPVAKALMRHSNPKMVNAFGPHVLFATQPVGRGRTAFLGINSTWRWRNWDERYFNRFWIQTLRYLHEGRLLGGLARGEIMLPEDRFELGESVPIQVRALTSSFQPLLVPSLETRVMPQQTTESGNSEKSSGAAVTLNPIAGREGFYEGRYVAESRGDFKLQLLLPAEGATADEIARTLEKEFLVVQPDLEMRNIAMNRSALRQLAEQAGHGSRYFDVDEAASLPNFIEDRSRTFLVRGRPRALWDNAYVFSALIFLLTLEWALRKKAKLL